MDFYLPWTGRMTCTWWLPDLLLFPPLQEFLRSLHLAAECTRNEISITKLAVISTAQHSNQEFSEGLFITTDSVLHQVIHEYWWGEGRIKIQEKKKNQKQALHLLQIYSFCKGNSVLHRKGMKQQQREDWTLRVYETMLSKHWRLV